MNIQVGDMLKAFGGSVCVVAEITKFSKRSSLYYVHWLKKNTSGYDSDDIEDIMQPALLPCYEKRAIELYFERLS